MAIGGYSWEGSIDLPSGFDTETGWGWFSVRIRIVQGDVADINMSSPKRAMTPALVDAIQEKLAILKVAPVGVRVDGVGWRRTEDLFYLRIYEYDLPLGEWK
jgi:hypothetical protein